MVKTHTNYSVGDFLIKIKNASMAKNKNVEYVAEKQVVAIAKALVRLGFLDGANQKDGVLETGLTFKNKKPLLMNIKLISKPGLRIYMTAKEINAKKGPSLYLITTPKGIMSSREAVKNNLGGEVIAEIL